MRVFAAVMLSASCRVKSVKLAIGTSAANEPFPPRRSLPFHQIALTKT